MKWRAPEGLLSMVLKTEGLIPTLGDPKHPTLGDPKSDLTREGLSYDAVRQTVPLSLKYVNDLSSDWVPCIEPLQAVAVV